MKKILKWTGIILLFLIAGLSIVVASRQNLTFDAPYPRVAASGDSAAIARGRSLVFGPAHCASCHSPRGMEEQVNKGVEVALSGGQEFKLPIGTIFVPNITPDATGIGKKTDQEIARSLRYGLRADGTALFDFMPFHNTSDEDLSAIISYLRSQPGVRNEVPSNDFNLIGKAVRAFLIKPVGPSGEVPVKIRQDTTAEYGRYLANNVANCRGCHTNRDLMTGEYIGEEYAGGLKMEGENATGKYYIETPNLTPDATGRITGWTLSQFISRFRAGARIPESHMPWGPFSRMSDDELKAIYNFLKTVKPVRNETRFGLQKAE